MPGKFPRNVMDSLATRFGIIDKLVTKIAPVQRKEAHELAYWRERKKAEGTMNNEHYQHFYTKHFGLDVADYRDQFIVDIGCGPRGSLEWATTAKRRIGVDPLADRYLELGASQHQMEYLAAEAEQIPLEDGECDAVFSFNSLDHVRDVNLAVKEIARITRSGGLFLLLVEINQRPTKTEPHTVTVDGLLKMLEPYFSAKKMEVYRRNGNGMYDSIRADDQVQDPCATSEVAYLSAKLVRHE
jgi:ubiquinone/menaquinone biosynthesis C-methylase UbiE